MVGIREFEAQPGLYLREVQAGETVRITDQGQVVAELRPPSERKEQSATPEARYRDLVERGAIRPATVPGDRAWAVWPGLGMARGSAQAVLDAEREE
jgi:antitoxin (DNA-binding transcriptional repressor) of toxin-antitoxin stability system